MAERRKFLLDEIVGNRSPLGLAVPNYFDCGVTSTPREKLLTQFGRQDPSSNWFVDFDDFVKYAAGDWTITMTGTTPTNALAAGAFGQLSMTNTAGASDVNSYQRTVAQFYLIAGKQAFFRTRLKVSHLDMGFFAGLQVVNSDPSGATDGIFFTCVGSGAGAVTLKAIAAAASNASTATLVTNVATTWHTYTWYYDGSTKLLASIDDGAPVSLAIANVPGPTIALAPTFGNKNTSTNARVMVVDFMLAGIER